MKKEVSMWKPETLLSSHGYNMAALASIITSSHNFQSRSEAVSLQEFPFIRKKSLSHKSQHTSLHIPLARTRSHMYSLTSHRQNRLGLQ